jgi:hypothetical protein
MISDCRLQIEVGAFFTGGFQAFKSEICILKSKITGLHCSRRLPHQGKTSKAFSGGGPKLGFLVLNFSLGTIFALIRVRTSPDVS